MSTPVIQPLSALTIQKIAAGEVIERPANVVKELVENALDAGATKISVTLEEGGKELIRVADNGLGMTRDDALVCWMPHTTSKIRAVEDLDSVASFGFRGEALASMAAVSDLTLETRHWEEETGTRLRITESREEENGVVARGQGTTITVRNLFRNNPVRRKFLGTARAETGRITTLLTRLSLAHPGVTFRLADGNRELLHLPEGTLRRRAGDVLGAHLLEDLVEVDWEGGGIHVQGFVSEPQRFSGRAGRQHFFVNRRHVHNPLLTRALSQAYEVAPPGRYPVAALFLSVAPAEIDVNIHPTKREIRFLNEARVYWALSQALRAALRGAVGAPALELDPEPPQGVPARGEDDEGFPHPTTTPKVAPPFVYTPAVSAEPGREREKDAGVSAADATAPGESRNASNVMSFPELPGHAARGTVPFEFAGVPCLQIHGSFIVVAIRGGYLLVNQRAAHERILYEKALEDLKRPGRFSAQQLLFPALVEFSAAEAAVVEKHMAELRTLGFDLEPFGSTAFQLRGSPADVRPEKAQTVLQELVSVLLEEPSRRGEGPDGVSAGVARAYARATAIPLNEPLDAARMAALVDGLFATRNPYVSPTGQPVLIRHSLEEIRRRFGIKAGETEPFRE